MDEFLRAGRRLAVFEKERIPKPLDNRESAICRFIGGGLFTKKIHSCSDGDKCSMSSHLLEDATKKEFTSVSDVKTTELYDGDTDSLIAYQPQERGKYLFVSKVATRPKENDRVR
jgi:hypothetical protein